jgi:hypothetical protein
MYSEGFLIINSFALTVCTTMVSVNKCVKLVHLVGFIRKKFVTTHGHMNIKNRHLFRFYTLIFFYKFSFLISIVVLLIFMNIFVKG